MNGGHLRKLRGNLLDDARQAVRQIHRDVQRILITLLGNDASGNQVETLKSLQHS